jgi:hypothetical protein
MKNPEKYECGSLRVKISECGRFHTPVRERTGKWEISGILSFVREIPAQNGRVGRYEYDKCLGDMGTGIIDVIGGPHDFMPPRSDEFQKLCI